MQQKLPESKPNGRSKRLMIITVKLPTHAHIYKASLYKIFNKKLAVALSVAMVYSMHA